MSSILEKEEFNEFQHAFDKYGSTMGQVKWEKHEAYLKEMSKRHPEEIFVLDIFGESVENISKKYFKNEKMFVAEAVVTYKEFDESLLQ